MLKLETIPPKFSNYLKLMVDFANTDPRIWGSSILRHPHLIFLECSHWVLWIKGFRRNSSGTSPRNCRNYNLGGGNSNILHFYADPWGFMIQFGDCAFFQMGGEKPPTSNRSVDSGQLPWP